MPLCPPQISNMELPMIETGPPAATDRHLISMTIKYSIRAAE